GVSKVHGWTRITPDDHGDWLKQRDARFDEYLALGIKDKNDASPRIFADFSLGVATARDQWAYSPSKQRLGDQMQQMIAAYNAEVTRMRSLYPSLEKKARATQINEFINNDPKE